MQKMAVYVLMQFPVSLMVRDLMRSRDLAKSNLDSNESVLKH